MVSVRFGLRFRFVSLFMRLRNKIVELNDRLAHYVSELYGFIRSIALAKGKSDESVPSHDVEVSALRLSRTKSFLPRRSGPLARCNGQGLHHLTCAKEW